MKTTSFVDDTLENIFDMIVHWQSANYVDITSIMIEYINNRYEATVNYRD